MSNRSDLPPFEIVRVEDASFAAAKRLRAYVAISPEDVDRAGEVAQAVIDEHGADNDVVVIFFHFSPESAGKSAAEVRAQYVRNGMKQGFVPKPLTNSRNTFEVEMPDGTLTVEKARNA